MFALCLLRVSPPVASGLADLCATDMAVDLVFANTTAAPSCHRGLSGSSFCVVPSGFPALPAVGLGLSGLSAEDFFSWLAAHPDSGFLEGSSWVLSPDDVSLLASAGVSCVSRAAPAESSSEINLSPGSLLAIIAGCVVGAALLAALAVAVFRRPAPDQLLLESVPSTYT